MALISHIHSILILRSLYFDSFSVTLTDLFFSVGMDTSMSRQLFSRLFLIIMRGVFVFISRYVCISISHKIVVLSFSVTVWGSCSYHFFFVYIVRSLQMFQCRFVADLLSLCSDKYSRARHSWKAAFYLIFFMM